MENLSKYVNTESLFALGIISILMMLIIPMPSLVLDFMLTISLAFSLLILLTAIFITKPLEFTAFPSVLLIITMLRLALNIASTRLILSHGHEGSQAAGALIESFGHFIIGNNFVIGIIIFIILIIINFIVITKGSGRIAEVSARFSLDSMPGKQMAIDADLNAGNITDVQAQQRRRELQEESNFFGSMDGAAKFVRGDAIAALLITIINIVAGILIGVLQKNLTLVNAVKTYTLLTVGDGLVSQVPALIISLAAGMVVAKGSLEGTLEKNFMSQLSNRVALRLVIFLLIVLSLIPGMPKLSFWLSAAILTLIVFKPQDLLIKKTVTAKQNTQEKPPEPEEPLNYSNSMDTIKIELGSGLLSLLNDKISNYIKGLRKQFLKDFGIIIPAVRIKDNLSIDPYNYEIYIKDIKYGKGKVYPDLFMAMNYKEEDFLIPGIREVEPTFKLPVIWIKDFQREEALSYGYTLIDSYTVIMTHLAETIKQNLKELLSYNDSQQILEEYNLSHTKLIQEIFNQNFSYSNWHLLLINLLQERVSIKAIEPILETLAENKNKNILWIVEQVRAKLGKYICNSLLNNGVLYIMTLSLNMEQSINKSLSGEAEIKQININPEILQQILEAVKYNIEKQNQIINLAVAAHLRPYIKTLLERFRNNMNIISLQEIDYNLPITSLGVIDFLNPSSDEKNELSPME